MAKTELSSPIDLIKKSINIFFKKENLIYFSKIYTISAAFVIFFMIQNSLGVVDFKTFQTQNIWLQISIAVVNLASFFVDILVGATAIEAVRRVVKGEDLDIKSTFRVGWKRYWKYLVLSILLALMIGFGFIALIIPGIIFLIWYSNSEFILVEEKAGVKEALSKSKELVKGRFWKVFGRSLIFVIFSALVSILVSMIPYVGSVVVTLAGALLILPNYLLYKELSDSK